MVLVGEDLLARRGLGARDLRDVVHRALVDVDDVGELGAFGARDIARVDLADPPGPRTWQR